MRELIRACVKLTAWSELSISRREKKKHFFIVEIKGWTGRHTTVRLNFSSEGGEVKKRNRAIKAAIS